MLVVCPVAGVGSRLHALTETRQKALIEVAGKPLIDHLVDAVLPVLPADARWCFVVGYKRKAFVAHVEATYGARHEVHFVTQEPVATQDGKPVYSGLGDAIALAADLGRGDDILVLLSDRFPQESYAPLVARLGNTFPGATPVDGVINTRRVADPRHYGVCVLDETGTYLARVVEKPPDPPSDLAIQGAYAFSRALSPTLFDLLEEQARQPLAAGREHQFTDVIQACIERGAKIGIHVMEKPVLDFGRVPRLLEGAAYLLRQQAGLALKGAKGTGDAGGTGGTGAGISPEATVTDCHVVPPVHVGPGCQVRRTVLGPNVSLAANCTVTGSVLADCVVGRGCHVESAVCTASVLGEEVTLRHVTQQGACLGDGTIMKF